LQGAEYEEFVKAAITEDEVQFVETSDGAVAKILFPGITSEEPFLGLVKSEPEKFEKFGKYLVHIFECIIFPLTIWCYAS
jgi:protein disulfide-isomerase A1